MSDAPPDPLPATALYTVCDPSALPFETTADLTPLDDPIGQHRAEAAVRLAVGMNHGGYNLFALGPAGIGKHAFLRRHLEQAVAERPVPPDWCYVHNFDEPHRPKALSLPPGRGVPLRAALDGLVEELRQAIPAAFESDEYRNRRGAIQETYKDRQETAFNALQEKAKAQDVALIRTPVGMALAPIRDGEVLSPKEFQALPEDERHRRQKASEALQAELEALLHEVPKWEKQQRDEIRDLNRETTEYAVGHLIDELKTDWSDHAAVLAHLEAVRADVIAHADAFFKDDAGQQAAGPTILGQASRGGDPMRRYQVNVIVDNGDQSACNDDKPGGPVVYEDHPTQPNLVGRIEHMSQFGTLVTDFTLIKAGALHRANGGCLFLDALKLLTQPFAWDTLKRCLRAERVRIESAAESLGFASTQTLEPEPIPLSVKVVLLGEPMLYYALMHYDPEFRELFRVAADFETRIDRVDGTVSAFARVVAGLVRRDGLRPLDRAAVARMVEHGARVAGDAGKLSTHMATLEDVVREADFWAAEGGTKTVGRDHVQRAIDARTYRSDRLRARIQEEIDAGTLVIETDGTRIGQVNGLAVLQLDHFAFGKPTRISCRVRLGKGEVVDIEREVALGGPLHSKGVLILSAFLSTRFAGDDPLSLSASLVFEQSYGGVDGDSASSAELYALLSALADVPLRQSLAVTGSVDQHGRVQAIGGVNEKIEGFFDVCTARGLTGEQGVLIPAANVRHLMLRDDVVKACADNRFHVYPVSTVDQGIALLTGMPAGEADAHGVFPIGSVNRAVARRLAAWTVKARPRQSEPESARRGRRRGDRADKDER